MEKAEIEGKQIKKANNCALQHIQTFLDQACEGVIADFGEPCENCIHSRDCNFDWFSILHPLRNHTDIKLRLGRSGAEFTTGQRPLYDSEGKGHSS